MKTNTKIFLFGASKGGADVLARLSKGVKVLGFLDNSTAKHGTEFLGYPVYGPEVLSESDYDFIIISSMYVAEIREQLFALGVPYEKVIVGITLDPREEPFPWDAVLFLSAISVIGIAALVWLCHWWF